MKRASLLRPYQREWFRALMSARNSLIVGPRQVGKDFTLQAWAAYEAHRVHGISPMAGVLAMNKDQRLSSNFLRGVTHFARQCSKAGIYRYDESSGKSGSATEVRWIVGEGHAFCKALPSQPDSPQGFTGSIAWNEVGANRHDPEEIWAQVRAASSADERFRLALVSNATRRGSWLDRLLHDDDEHWRAKRASFGAHIYVTTIYDVYPEGLPAWLDEIRQSMTRAAWARWYEARFVDGGEGPLSEYMRDTADAVELGNEVGRPILSVDPGITTDPTGVVVLSSVARGWKVTHSELWYQKPVDDQIEAILALYRSLRPRLVVVDPGTQGHYIYSSLQRQLGPQVVVAGKANAEAYNRQLQRLEDLTRSAALSVPAAHQAVGEHLGEICRDERDRVVVPYVPDGPQRRHHCDLGVAVMMAADHIGATVRVAPVGRSVPSWLSSPESARSTNNPFS